MQSSLTGTVKSTHQKTHEQFNDNGSDIILQSSDGIFFRLYRKYLEATTGAFPGPDDAKIDATSGDITKLSEPANILEILFQFVFPKRHPNLKDVEFSKILGLAEAVEKYEVFAAMSICEIRLREHISEYPVDIFAHAIRHEYPSIINETALTFARKKTPLHELFKKIPPVAMNPWLRYHDAWKSIFRNSYEHLDHIPSNTRCGPGKICAFCRNIITVWISEAERVETVPFLQLRLFNSSSNLLTSAERDQPRCEECANAKCRHLDAVVRLCQNGVTNMPQFTEFLYTQN